MTELRNDAEMAHGFRQAAWSAETFPFRFLGDPVLRSVCDEVAAEEFGTPQLAQVVAALKTTLVDYRAQTGVGRGLAANQIGVAKRIIVVLFDNGPEVLINPRLKSSVGLGSYWESCLSSGTLLIGEVHRAWQGTFIYQDEAGKERTEVADELRTRVYLHEMDHLDGTTCDRRYEPNTMRLIRRGLEEILGCPFVRLDKPSTS